MRQLLEHQKKSYTYDEALAATLEYFNGAELAAKVFLDKYCLRDKEGNYRELTPDYMHKRLAFEFARMDANHGMDHEERYNVYYNALRNFQNIVAQGSPMAAVGNPYQIMSASNCVVVESPRDSMEGIIRSGEELAQLMKRRCGVGIDVSTLRPEGFTVNNAAKTTSGAWSFCDFYSYITRMVCQSGRRGALMITMDVHHPDIEQFATLKLDKTKATGANISIRYSDAFMNAVETDSMYEQRWPLTGEPKFTRRVRARQVWKTVTESATKSAEPGCIFWDTMTRRLPAHSYPRFETKSTNPCSEIPLSAYDACRLISMNLTGYVSDPFNNYARFDWDTFKHDVELAAYMSDNLVDLELERIEMIMEVCETSTEKELWHKLYSAGYNGRRVGLGTHGLGDTLAQLKLAYDSDEALTFVDKLYRTLRDEFYKSSIKLAKERGAFPAFDWEVEKNNDFIKDLPQDIKDEMAEHGRRNIAGLTNAPTGSVSIESKTGRTFNTYGTSSGVEPPYTMKGKRRRKISHSDDGARVDFVDEFGDQWQEYEVLHPNLQNYFTTYPASPPDYVPDYFVTADTIDWSQRVVLQGTEQKYIDHSISSTINLPKGTTTDVVATIYMEAWKNGCKGVTVYVDGSRTNILTSEKDVDNPCLDPSERPEKIIRMEAPKRPKVLECDIHHTTCQGKKYIAIVGFLDGEPYEFFGGYPSTVSIPKRLKSGKIIKKAKGKYCLHVGKNGDTIIIKDIAEAFSTPQMGWTTRLISAALRHGAPIDFLVEQLTKEGKLWDFNRVIGRVLKKYIKNGSRVRSSLKCFECGGSNMVWQDCPICMDCGASKCS
jgi:ribonucleoside-diphosphate reductase alpha chain